MLLAMHAVEKSGDELDEDAVAEALKEVLKRHPEWKSRTTRRTIPADSG